MGVIEPIAIGLGIHLGKKVVDWVWKIVQDGGTPFADQQGNLGFTNSNFGQTTVGKDFTVTGYQDSELISGKFYLPDSIRYLFGGHEIALILIIEETTQETLLFTTDIDSRYEIYLPHGIYSFYVFLMDTNADDFLFSEIYAIGFPSKVDLSEYEHIEADHPDDIWELISDSSKAVTFGGPYNLDFILIDTDWVDDFPKFFYALLGSDEENQFNLNGLWKLEEEYEFGSTDGDIYLIQTGNMLYGLMLIEDTMDDGTELLIEQTISGEIAGGSISLAGTSVRAIKGWVHDYQLDRWNGILDDHNTIAGVSEDLAGTMGTFVMKRISH